MIRIAGNTSARPPLVMTIVDDPVELAKTAHLLARFNRNLDWYQAHLEEIVAAHRGQCVCIAGQELFVASTLKEAVEMGRKAHPEDEGSFYVRYIRPVDRQPRASRAELGELDADFGALD